MAWHCGSLPDMSSKYGIRDSRGVAGRAIENLDLVRKEQTTFGNGHLVTQIVMTALTVLVIPYEEAKREDNSSLLADAERLLDKAFTTDGKGRTLARVRNAIAHGRISYSDSHKTGGSVSTAPSKVTVTLEDVDKGQTKVSWTGSIQADRLEELLRQLYKLLGSYH